MEQLWLALGLLVAPAGASAPACAGCHADVALDHRASRHHVAWTNAIFAEEYGEHPKPWCVSCHAPEVAPADRATPPPSAREGVSCASCHRPTVAGAAIRARSRRSASIHRTQIDPDFGRGASCGGCHQFNFPILDSAGALLAYTDEPMQNTVAEAAGADCIDCHDSHVFAGSHRPSLVRSALELDLCRDGGVVVFSIANRGAAHSVPSGGVNRFMTASLWRSSAPERLAQLRLGRRFGPEVGGVGKRTIEDTTIDAGDTARLRSELDALGGAATESINAEIRYIYTPGPERTLADGGPSQVVIARLRTRPAELPTCGPITSKSRAKRRPARRAGVVSEPRFGDVGHSR